METTNVQVRSLFGGDVQYIIPIFQRHYVWDQEEQWDPLWKDIQTRVQLSGSMGQQSIHFTGAIVIQQRQTNVNEVPKYEIIDGQQRLTTFQIVLCALRDVCKSLQFSKIEADAGRHILNQGLLLDASDNERYKLIPTDFDRTSFISLVDKSVDGQPGKILEAYDYFKTQIEGYVNCDRNKMLTLFHSILNSFGFVQIRIDSDDQPEKIFESLNARGKPLLQFDLLRNSLFLRARIEVDVNQLYRDYWMDFENPYWEAEVTVAREKIALSELFFQHFLMTKLGEEKVTPLFNTYERNIIGHKGVEYELSELKRYSETYQEIVDCSPDSEIGRAMSFYRTFDITTLHPFVLFIKNELGVSGPDLSTVLHILESYTMRRLLCFKGGTQNYTQLVSRLIKGLRGKRFDLKNLISILSNEEAEATRWPADSDVETYLKSGWHDYKINRKIIRYILYRIELMKQQENPLFETNELAFNSKLSLEHIMPEAWKRTWSLPMPGKDGELSLESEDRISYRSLFHDHYREDNPEWETDPSEVGLADENYQQSFELAKSRDSLLQSIGNLTLVTSRHNSRLSNRSFSEKRESLYRNSLLVLNKEIYGRHDIWDIPQINQRQTELFTAFRSIWPSAENFAKRQVAHAERSRRQDAGGISARESHPSL